MGYCCTAEQLGDVDILSVVVHFHNDISHIPTEADAYLQSSVLPATFFVVTA